MKYIKEYNIFSEEEKSQRVSEIKDLFLVLSDKGYVIEIRSDSIFIIYGNKPFLFTMSDVLETLEFAINYMREHFNLKIKYFEVDCYTNKTPLNIQNFIFQTWKEFTEWVYSNYISINDDQINSITLGF